MAVRQQDEYRSVWRDMLNLPLHQHWIDADGVRTRIVQVGDKALPPLIMLHGTAGHWETFCGNFTEHCKHFHCIGVDMIGHGFTDKPDHDFEISHYVEHLHGVMDALGLSRASLLGVSLGGWIAARFAINFPGRLDKMTLVSPGGLFANPPTMNAIKTVRTGAVDDPSWKNIQQIFEELVMDAQNCVPDIIGVRQTIYRQPSMKQAMPHILILQNYEVRRRNLLSEDEWRSIRAPTLLIGAVDQKDEYLETARRVAKLIPGAQYAEIKAAKHWPHFEQPVEFNRINLDFLLNAQVTDR